jgi:hypothetical protein
MSSKKKLVAFDLDRTLIDGDLGEKITDDILIKPEVRNKLTELSKIADLAIVSSSENDINKLLESSESQGLFKYVYGLDKSRKTYPGKLPINLKTNEQKRTFLKMNVLRNVFADTLKTGLDTDDIYFIDDDETNFNAAKSEGFNSYKKESGQSVITYIDDIINDINTKSSDDKTKMKETNKMLIDMLNSEIKDSELKRQKRAKSSLTSELREDIDPITPVKDVSKRLMFTPPDSPPTSFVRGRGDLSAKISPSDIQRIFNVDSTTSTPGTYEIGELRAVSSPPSVTRRSSRIPIMEAMDIMDELIASTNNMCIDPAPIVVEIESFLPNRKRSRDVKGDESDNVYNPPKKSRMLQAPNFRAESQQIQPRITYVDEDEESGENPSKKSKMMPKIPLKVDEDEEEEYDTDTE